MSRLGDRLPWRPADHERTMPLHKRIDTHVHLWDPGHVAIPWLVGLDLLNRPFGLDDYREHVVTAPVAAFVAVEAGVAPADALVEARWLAALANQEPRLAGIVAAAPVEAGAQLEPYLEEVTEIGPLVKGVRRILQGEADPAFCLRPDFVAGVRLLPAFGLSFDLCVAHSQLPAVTRLVQACPDTQFILDHLGKPLLKAGVLDPWRDDIAALAALPNVVCKLSGLVTEATPERWTVGELRPYVAHVLAVFGPERVLFGSDWPVALQALSYERWMTALQTLTAQLSPADQDKLWFSNARRVYRLDLRERDTTNVSP